ncbi:MAG: hypothetical protein ACREME_01705 [Gemmatimonadales bacterium]
MWVERVREIARNQRVARGAGGAWGFAEGVFFFIVPDVYVSFATLFALRAGAVAWAASIAGSLAAVCTIYLLAVVLHLDYLGFLELIPGISAGMLVAVERGFGAGGGGLPYTAWLITGGVPLKVYAGVAFAQGIGVGSVLVWTVFARIVRIAPVYLLAAAVRLVFRPSIDARPARWLGVLAALWVAFYAFYFVTMSHLRTAPT